MTGVLKYSANAPPSEAKIYRPCIDIVYWTGERKREIPMRSVLRCALWM